jgi:peptidoglycan L-alanyl-D-glutamate endopeptidase CwlK
MLLNVRSEKNREGVHPDLVRVIRRAAKMVDKVEFIVTEGVRDKGRQAKLLSAGASSTMKSRHIPESNLCGMSCAVDLAAVVDGQVRWDFPLYGKLAIIVKEAARLEGVKIVWGGDFKKLVDGPHFELDRRVYPFAQ